MTEHLPDNDPDLKLARKIGDLLEEQAPLSADQLGGEPFHASLEEFRSRAAAGEAPSDALWDRIAAATREDRRARVLPHPAVWRWAAVAATVLVASALAWMLMTRAPSAELAAAAGSEVLEYVDAEGTGIALRPHSRLYRLRAEEGTVAYRLEGEAFFEVTGREAGTFVVRADEVSVQVRGTRFNVSTWGEKIQVFVETGLVEVIDHRTERSAELTAGEWAGIVPDGRFLVEHRSAEESLDWMTGELVFELRPVGTVVSELEHHFQIRIDLPAHVARETVSGRVFLEAPEQSLADLGLVLGGSFRRTSERTYRFEPHG